MIDVSEGVPGVNGPDPRSYDEFWAYYLSQHLHPMTQRVHAAGTAAAMLTGLTALRRRKWKLFAASPLLAYVPAFASHYIWEGNSPVVISKGKPIWAAMADLQMVFKVLTGRIGPDAVGIRAGLGMRPAEITLADHERSLQPAA
jgi:hypothetical protein